MLSFAALFLIVLSYSSWFLTGTQSSGDWPYLYLENIKEFSFIPDPHNLWLGLYYQIPTKILVQYLNLPWEFVEKLLWFWPFLIISIFSSYYFTRSYIGVLIYVTNTYILMVVGGGQMGIAMAYSLAPAVLGSFIKLLKLSELKTNFKLIRFSLLFSVLVMFDPRIAYILGIGFVLFFMLKVFLARVPVSQVLTRISYIILVSAPVIFLINSFWLVPFIRGKSKIPFENFDSLGGFRFFSFTDFSHTLSLLHPNWPENLFGKVYFIQPEFILIPIIAYASLLFLGKEQREKKIMLLYFSILGILGAFLAKGVSEPFSFINTFAFSTIPGMNLFRDATKWYLLIILSYSILIPYAINSLQVQLGSKLPLRIRNFPILPIIFIVFWIFTIRQAVFHQLSGTFVVHSVPKEYVELKDYLLTQPDSFKTLWVPARQRYGFSSKKIEAISAENMFKTNDLDKMLFALSSVKSREILNKNNILFIIVPFDLQKELFITDRKYDELKYQKVLDLLNTLSWLRKTRQFGKIAVFEVF